MEQIRDPNRKVVITVAKKPHTGSLLSTAPQLARSPAGPKTGEEATRHAMAVLASLHSLFGGRERESRETPDAN